MWGDSRPTNRMVGGPLGSGRQYWSWIHLHDWVALVAWLAESARQPVADATAGPRVSAYNATAPHPVTNAEFTSALGRAMGRPAVMPAPAFALRLALGEMADSLLLVGQRALPTKAQRHGFTFAFPTVEAALQDLYRGRAAA